MSLEFENLLVLLTSSEKQYLDLGLILAQNYKDEFKDYFKFELEKAEKFISEFGKLNYSLHEFAYGFCIFHNSKLRDWKYLKQCIETNCTPNNLYQYPLLWEYWGIIKTLK